MKTALTCLFFIMLLCRCGNDRAGVKDDPMDTGTSETEIATFAGGYNTFADAGNGLSIGTGIFVRELTIDHSYVPMGDLGSSNYLGVAIRGW